MGRDHKQSKKIKKVCKIFFLYPGPHALRTFCQVAATATARALPFHEGVRRLPVVEAALEVTVARRVAMRHPHRQPREGPGQRA